MRPAHAALLLALAAPPTFAARIIHVRSDAPPGGNGASWATAYNDLSAASLTAQVGDEIWVARGTYLTSKTNDPTEVVFVHTQVKLRGGFVGNETSLAQRPQDPDIAEADPAFDTIISGELGAPGSADNAERIIQVNIGAAPETLIERVVVTGGFSPNAAGAGIRAAGAPTIADSLIIGNEAIQGAGISAIACNGIVIRDCVFTDNRSNTDAGGLLLASSTATVERCVFVSNAAGQVGFFGTGGGLATTGSTVRITECTFDSNEAIYGGGLYADFAATIERCTIRNNNAFSPFDPTGATRGFAGGIYIDGGPVIRDCEIIENTGDNAGGMTKQGNIPATFERCRFIRNTSRGGGGGGALIGQDARFINCLFDANAGFSSPMLNVWAYPSPASALIINCTSVNHVESPFFPGALRNSGSIVIFNSIFRNQGVEVGGNAPGAGWSNIEGFVGGLANIDQDPMFVNPAAGDYRLKPGSPCIDRGRNDQVPSNLLTDLDGMPRFIDDPGTSDAGFGSAPIVDIGAFEFAPPDACPGDANNDGIINFADITDALANFGGPGPSGDANDDSAVNFADITTILSNWGALCT